VSNPVRAYAASGPKAELMPFQFDPGPLRPEQVEIRVQSCGICHSDLSMWGNDWGMTTYPFVPGHEVVGTVAAVGDRVPTVKVGDTVGLGWFSHSCQACRTCLGGDQNLCATAEQTIVGRHGGFADRVRANWEWVLPLPAGVDPASAGPLFCGGVTAFNPLVQFDVRPTHRVGVVGVGGLGHLAILFLTKWGCEVVAFTNPAKLDEAKQLGAHHAVSSRDAAFPQWAGRLDFILVTVNADLPWQAYMDCLAPKGRLHFVGAVPSPVSAGVFPMMLGQKQISASPLGSPTTAAALLDFCGRHRIAPVTETFPMSKVNEAFARLEGGKAKYRIVLTADF
jgi:alcohol/geraniol dehydrogenase (NADP+)